MSFLDNLENNLKALESREEVDPQAAARRQADAEAQRREQALIAPHARALKESGFAARAAVINRAAARRQADAEAQRREQALIAPHARALKESGFAARLMTAARAVGHRQRVLVRFTWIEDTLRLEAGTRRLDMAPASDGIHAISSEDGATRWSTPVDLAGNPEQLASRWLA